MSQMLREIGELCKWLVLFFFYGNIFIGRAMVGRTDLIAHFVINFISAVVAGRRAGDMF